MVLVFGAAICLRALPASGASFATAPDVAWSQPGATTLQATGPAAGPVSIWKGDCTPLTYRLTGDLSHTMQQGCFTAGTYGLFDASTSIIIPNGTDEGMPARHLGNNLAAYVLPYSANMVTFGGYPMFGSYMYVYTDFASAMHQVDGLHPYKNVDSPTTQVMYGSNQPLPVNATAFGVSAKAQWVVTESPGRALLRINLADYSILPFGPPLGSESVTHEASMAISEDGRYAAVSRNGMLTVYDLATCNAATSSDVLAPRSCQSHDYWSTVANKISGLSFVSQLNFVQDGLLSFNATATNGAVTSYVMAPDSSIGALIPYLGMGDSYASGQGTFDYRAGTDTKTNKCHASVHGYPTLLSGAVFSSQGQSVACSGARITDLSNEAITYAGQVTDGLDKAQRDTAGSSSNILHDFLPGYLAQWEFVKTYQPGAITVQVGGNDAGFSAILQHCLNVFTSQGNCYASYEDRLELEQTIDRIYPRWVALFSQLHSLSPTSRIYAVGYPQILSAKGQCGLNTPLTAPEVTFARSLTSYLNGVLQQAAQAAGVQYVDIANALSGFELCSGNAAEPAMNGLTAGTDTLGILGQESFHPTAFGHQLIEQAILNTTHNLASGTNPARSSGQGTPTTGDSDELLQGVPRTGRSLAAITYVDTMVPARLKTGASTRLFIANTSEYSLATSSTYTIVLDSNQTLATVQSGFMSASITATVTIPTGTPNGIHTITISGTDRNDAPLQLTEVVTTYQDINDYDGDGIDNGHDSCRLVPNAGVDQDQDGIDDRCDTTISAPASATPPPNNNTDTPVTSPNTNPVSDAGGMPQPATTTAADALRASAPTILATAEILPTVVATPKSTLARTGQVLGVSSTSAATQPASLHAVTTRPTSGTARLTVGVGRSRLVQWYDWILLLLLVPSLVVLVRRRFTTIRR